MKNHFHVVLFAILFTFLVNGPAEAVVWNHKKVEKPKPNAFSMSATLGGYSFDSSQGLDNGILYGLKVGYDFNGLGPGESLGLEGVASVIQAGSGGGGNGTAYQFRLDAIYPLMLNKKLIPFLALGGGWMVANGGGVSENGPVVAGGFGAKYFFKNYLAVRADFRDLLWFDAGQENNFEYTLGLTYLFGQKREKKPAPLPDADQDGVPDLRDKCPDTPPGVRVDSRGCPTDTTDSDHDGVSDYKDKCSGTPRGAKVDKEGCPLDSDHDGVPDTLDRCPGTPSGVEVDSTGCVKVGEPSFRPDPQPGAVTASPASPGMKGGEGATTQRPEGGSGILSGSPTVAAAAPGETGTAPAGMAAEEPAPSASSRPEATAPGVGVKAEPASSEPAPTPEKTQRLRRTARAAANIPPKRLTIQFDFDRTIINATYRPALGALAAELKASPEKRVVIEGHTDNVGSRAYNLKLSRRRAASVKTYLVGQGVDPRRITLRGMGSDYPVADNATEAGRQKNRRAVAVIRIN